MKRSRMLTIVVVLSGLALPLISGCQGGPVNWASPAQLQNQDKFSDESLLTYYRFAGPPDKAIEGEILRRDLLTEEQINRVNSHALREGDSIKMALAMFGRPRSVNHYESGRRRQYVFRHFMNTYYIHTDQRGVIQSWTQMGR